MGKRCATCRYWDRLHIGSLKGDCRSPSNNRFWHVPLEMPDKDGKIYKSVAYMDSFGVEETKHDYGCGAWDDGASSSPFDKLSRPQPPEGRE